uniref:Uncharacterized protein n=1 Tax=Fagus sylvatica TaxID=28930 RepID=A0A2N9ECH7_FAGSY
MVLEQFSNLAIAYMASTEASSSSSFVPTQNSLISIENSRSPCYLNNGDNPGIRIVPEPLTGDNYQSWRRSVTTALSTKNKLGFVNGAISQPTDESDPLYSDWQRCNDLVLSWITNCLSRDIHATVFYVYIAKEVWDDLQQRYTQSNGTWVHHLKQAITALKMDNSMTQTFPYEGMNQTLPYPNTFFNTGSNALLSQFDNNRSSQYSRKDRPICSHCGLKGHTTDKCYKLHGYPPGFRGKNRNGASANQSGQSSQQHDANSNAHPHEAATSLATVTQPPLNMAGPHALEDDWTKFDPRARTCAFLGYPSGVKGYKLLDLHTSKPLSPIHNSPPPLRKSTRVTQPPGYLKDFHYQLAHSGIIPTNPSSNASPNPLHPLSSTLSYAKLSPSHRNFSLSVTTISEPISFSLANQDPHWQEAMLVELSAFEANHTWSLTTLPPGKHPIG